MFRRKQTANDQPRGKKFNIVAPPALQLHAINGDIAIGIPEAMLQPLRHMTTRLSRQATLPSKIAMVSALRQEGVTTLATVLGTLLAHDTKKTVCVIDLNWWWPSNLLLTPGTHSSGLSGAVQGNVRWSSALVRTNFPNLTVLPAGTLALEECPVVARSTELKNIIDEMAITVDYLIMDIPAILSTSDAIPLASLSEACCLVTQQGITARGTVRRALQEIDHIPLLGMVMNRIHTATPMWIAKWLI